MRHRVAFRKLNRTSSHRLAMLGNMVSSLLEYETVEAEEVRAILDGRPHDRKRGVEVAPEPETSAERPVAEEPKRAEKPSRLPPKISPEPA